MQLIGHGAQAKVYKVERDDKYIVIKERIPKKYRHPELDKKINESRIKSQAKIMDKLYQKGMNVPAIIKTNVQEHKIQMQYLDGQKLKDNLNKLPLFSDQIDNILRAIGLIIKQVHECGIIHGDLTTSNMIIKENSIYLIDFGLSYTKDSAEDRAVDLYVLERAFKSTHPQLEDKFDLILVSYGIESAIKKLQVVRQRGRKKVAFG